MSGKRKSYTASFKREAVSMVLDKGMSRHAVERQLGLSQGVVYRWVRHFQSDPENCFPGHGNMKPHELEIHRLKRENAALKREHEILKKALAIFSKEPKRYMGL
jgi:transposase